MDPREELVTKATEDPEFRERLKANPRATVAQEFGVNIPDDIEISVLEETPKHAYIVLPAQATRTELSSEDLDAVAGGGGPGIFLDPGSGWGGWGLSSSPDRS